MLFFMHFIFIYRKCIFVDNIIFHMSIKSIIVAIDLNNAIGLNNNLLCHLPNDLKHFKEVTVGHSIIMGHKTFNSLPNGALPNRKNIVLTRNKELELEGCVLAHSLQDALILTEREKQVFIIGGASIYKEAINIVDNIYVTQINYAFKKADAFFPKIDLNVWKKTSQERFLMDDRNQYEHSFILYERILK